ncbi:hypothetical protein GCK32_017603 [Trichostrongylus colubriformis]|uniref:CCHC-type domain-containing protein n=1 Tax=Trichostrongylus colubriformis TaxID=6319 RepID=A0AAN8G193_TRICO
MVAGYEITDANYELAINTLRETYSRPEFVRVQTAERLQKLRPATSSAIVQRITLAQVKSIWLQLEKMGESDNNVFVMCLIRDKFPSKTLEYVGHLRANDSTSWGVSQLLDGIDQAIRTFEAIEDSVRRRESSSHVLALRSTSRSSSRGSSSPPTARRSVRERRSSQSPLRSRRHESHSTFRCMFCRSREHPTTRCDRVTSIKVRWRIALQENLCFKCLSDGHGVNQCDKPQCMYCQGGHHVTLCRTAARNSSRKHRPGSTTGDSETDCLNRSLQERATSSQRHHSPVPENTRSTRNSSYSRGERSRSPITSQNSVLIDPREQWYVGALVNTEDEDSSTFSLSEGYYDE